jgi:hypothetical protein
VVQRRENILSTSASKWHTSSEQFVLTTSDYEVSFTEDTVSYQATFDSLPRADVSSSEIVSDIDIVRANYVYNLQGCFQITSNTESSDRYPINVYLR